MNGLHSKKKLRSAYPQFDDRILRHIYSGLPPSGRRLKNQLLLKGMCSLTYILSSKESYSSQCNASS